MAINNFSDEYKVPFTMYLAGYKYNEIAEKMSLPLGTVKILNKSFYEPVQVCDIH